MNYIGSKLSLLEFLEEIHKLTGKKPEVKFDNWRPSDQKVYITDITKVSKALDWKQKVNAQNGIKKLVEWVRQNEDCFS